MTHDPRRDPDGYGSTRVKTQIQVGTEDTRRRAKARPRPNDRCDSCDRPSRRCICDD